MIYIVIYISKDERRNPALEQAIQKYPDWAIINRSAFIVNTLNDRDGKGSKVIADNLTRYIDNNKEKILVAHLSRPISWRNFKVDFAAWLRKNFSPSEEQQKS